MGSLSNVTFLLAIIPKRIRSLKVTHTQYKLEIYEGTIQLYLCSLEQVFTSKKKGKHLFINYSPKYVIHTVLHAEGIHMAKHRKPKEAFALAIPIQVCIFMCNLKQMIMVLQSFRNWGNKEDGAVNIYEDGPVQGGTVTDKYLPFPFMHLFIYTFTFKRHRAAYSTNDHCLEGSPQVVT